MYYNPKKLKNHAKIVQNADKMPSTKILIFFDQNLDFVLGIGTIWGSIFSSRYLLPFNVRVRMGTILGVTVFGWMFLNLAVVEGSSPYVIGMTILGCLLFGFVNGVSEPQYVSLLKKFTPLVWSSWAVGIASSGSVSSMIWLSLRSIFGDDLQSRLLVLFFVTTPILVWLTRMLCIEASKRSVQNVLDFWMANAGGVGQSRRASGVVGMKYGYGVARMMGAFRANHDDGEQPWSLVNMRRQRSSPSEYRASIENMPNDELKMKFRASVSSPPQLMEEASSRPSISEAHSFESNDASVISAKIQHVRRSAEISPVSMMRLHESVATARRASVRFGPPSLTSSEADNESRRPSRQSFLSSFSDGAPLPWDNAPIKSTVEKSRRASIQKGRLSQQLTQQRSTRLKTKANRLKARLGSMVRSVSGSSIKTTPSFKSDKSDKSKKAKARVLVAEAMPDPEDIRNSCQSIESANSMPALEPAPSTKSELESTTSKSSSRDSFSSDDSETWAPGRLSHSRGSAPAGLGLGATTSFKRLMTKIVRGSQHRGSLGSEDRRADEKNRSDIENAIKKGLGSRDSVFSRRRTVVSLLTTDNFLSAGRTGCYAFWICEYLNGFLWAFAVGTIVSMQTRCSFDANSVFGAHDDKGSAEMARSLLATCFYVGSAIGS